MPWKPTGTSLVAVTRRLTKVMSKVEIDGILIRALCAAVGSVHVIRKTT